MPFKKIDMQAEGEALQELLASSDEARLAHKVFNDEYSFRMKLAQARKAQGITQAQIKTHSGMTQQVISRMEHGTADDRSPTLRTVLRYLDAIGCELQVVKRKNPLSSQRYSKRKGIVKIKVK